MTEREYGMSYSLHAGLPKAKADLTRDEGLTDRLLVVSILHSEGGGASAMLLPLDASGVAPLSDTDMLLVASTILDALADEGITNAAAVARDALSIIRAAVVGERAFPSGQE